MRLLTIITRELIYKRNLLPLLMITLLFQCSDHNIVAPQVKTSSRLLAEVDYFQWLADSNKYIPNSKALYTYQNGVVSERYDYGYYAMSGQATPGFYLERYTVFSQNSFGQTILVELYNLNGAYQQIRFSYNGNKPGVGVSKMTISNVEGYTKANPIYQIEFLTSMSIRYTTTSSEIDSWQYFPSSNDSTRVVYAVDANNNISSITAYDEQGNFTGSNTITYDDHPNPYHDGVGNFLLPEETDLSLVYRNNNITQWSTITAQAQQGSPLIYTYVNQYDTAGYLISSTIKETKGKSTFQYH